MKLFFREGPGTNKVCYIEYGPKQFQFIINYSHKNRPYRGKLRRQNKGMNIFKFVDESNTEIDNKGIRIIIEAILGDTEGWFKV